MKIEVIQGTDVIGGSIVKIYGKNKAILIDLGESLDGRILGDNILEHALENVDDIFITHYHTDHIALLNHPLLEGKNFHLSKLTKDVLDSKGIKNHSNYFIMSNKTPIYLDNLVITPYKSDHSASDSYMFLIDDGIKKVLHTGDFRMHGTYPWYNEIINEFSKNKDLKIDLLITEGTYYNTDYKFIYEDVLRNDYFYVLFLNRPFNFVYVPSTNFNRMKELYDLSIELGYKFYMYKAARLLFQKAYPNIEVHPLEFANVGYMEDENFIAIFSPSDEMKRMYNRFSVGERNLVYSAWIGYLNPKYKKIYDFFMDTPFTYIHTAGHCDKESIDKFIDIVKPDKILPIHTEAIDEFMTNYDNVINVNDLQVFEI